MTIDANAAGTAGEYERSIFTVGVLLLAAATFLLQKTIFGSHLDHIPLVRSDIGDAEKRWRIWEKGAKELYREGCRQFKSVFRVTTPEGDRVMVPYHLLDEIKAKGDDELSNVKALDAIVLKELTGIRSVSPLMNHIVKADLTTALTRINPGLEKAAAEAIESELPSCEDWTGINFNAVMLRVVAIVSGYIFIGPDLCRKEEYLHASIRYTIDAFSAVRQLKTWRKWLRPVVASWIPEIRKIRDHKERAKRFLVPVIQARKKAMLTEGYQAPDDMLQWMINKADKFEEIQTDEDLAVLQLALSMAAIHTTTTTITHLMYDIACRPELVKELRAEIESVVGECDGVMSTQALYKMRLLDSVMKESQRVNPLGFVGFPRQTIKGIKLSDGTYIPPNVSIEAPVEAIGNDNAVWDDAETFDPYRFYRLRQNGGENANRHQFVTLGKGVLSFGYGKHGCPGRFFAANEIKLLVIGIIRKFDVKTIGGERYENLEHGISNTPDVGKELLFQRIQSGRKSHRSQQSVVQSEEWNRRED